MFLAAIFFLHGTKKAFGWFDGQGWTATIESWSDPQGLAITPFLAAAAILTEVIASLALFLGLFTRIAALAVACVMAGAVYFVHADAGFASSEYPLALMVIGLSLACLGGGRLSMDRTIASLLMPPY